jgi:redox-sensing transcriptional repressor
MDSKKKISIAVIKRLPRYYRYLYDLLKLDVKRISSKELSERMNITASQIRQDLNCFGGFGQQGYGYNVEVLYSEIGKILGLTNNYKTIIIGAGNMGRALANYSNFEKRGFDLIGIFDKKEELIGTEINKVKVIDMEKLSDFIKENHVDIAMLCVPYSQTSILAEKVANLGVKGLWNFSPMDLELKQDVIIENVHLSDSLMVLGYKLNEKINNENKK